jgi:TPR repeat protein
VEFDIAKVKGRTRPIRIVMDDEPFILEAFRSGIMKRLAGCCLIVVACATTVRAEGASPSPTSQAQPPPDELQSLRARADQGDAAAQYNLAARYGKGDGVPVNQEKAAALYRKAADHGLAKAQAALARSYAKGEGVPQDYAQAVTWFRKAADQGNANAQYNLGLCYAKGKGVPQDYVNAVTWFRKAAEQDDDSGEYNLGIAFLRGNGVVKDSKQAEQWLQRAAARSNLLAQCVLGIEYFKGVSLPLSSVEALKWVSMALPQAKAAEFLTCSGITAPPPVNPPHGLVNGVDLSPGRRAYVRTPFGTVAVKCLSISKESVEVLVDGEMASRSLRKSGPEDVRSRLLQEAYIIQLKTERRVAGKPNPRSDGAVPSLIIHGPPRQSHDQLPEPELQEDCGYRMAAEQGDAAAQFGLGDCYRERYHQGRGAPGDLVEAVGWYRRAAEQGFPQAQFNLGVYYDTGVGVPQNRIEAYKWLSLAAAQGQGGALELREWVAKGMSDAEIIEGQRRSSAFVARTENSGSEREGNARMPETTKQGISAGTGFFVTDDGYFVTCEHVVHGATSLHVGSPGGSLAATLIKSDRTIDVALLKVEGAFGALPVVPAPRVKLGDSVFTIGFPNPEVQGVAPKLTRGEISSMAGMQDNPRYFQISVPVQPGNSGGALVDEWGNVVGVVTARLSDMETYEISGALPQNVNYAVKGNLVRNFLETIPGLSTKLKGPRATRDREAASTAGERATMLVIAQ